MIAAADATKKGGDRVGANLGNDINDGLTVDDQKKHSEILDLSRATIARAHARLVRCERARSARARFFFFQTRVLRREARSSRFQI